MDGLKPCPFCGGEMKTAVVTFDEKFYESPYESWYLEHIDIVAAFEEHCPIPTTDTCYDTEAEAIAAWNTRAAYEMDGWFYLPKPKQQLFNYTTGFSFDDISLKATGTVDVYAMTRSVQKWQEEALNAQIIERICEVFKPERTCRILKTWSDSDYVDGWRYRCSECGCFIPVDERDPETGDVIRAANYCPNCGAKVVGE